MVPLAAKVDGALSRHSTQIGRHCEWRLFFARVEAVFEGVPLEELSDDALEMALSAAMYVADLALVEAERRGMAGGEPVCFVPYGLPEGVDYVETCLTRGQGGFSLPDEELK